MKTILQHSQSGIQYNFPVEGCLFFGVPNLGTEYADGAAKILRVLNTVFNVNRNVVQELVNKSQRLANIASEFRQIRNEHKIPVISFFETVKYNNVLGLVSIRLSFAASLAVSPSVLPWSRLQKLLRLMLSTAFVSQDSSQHSVGAHVQAIARCCILLRFLHLVFIANGSDCQ